jgi:hypothetical protein
MTFKNYIEEKLAELLEPPVKRSINQKELEELEGLRANQARLKKELADTEAALKGLESSIIGRLKMPGTRIYGRLTATVQEVAGASHPRYKEELLKHMFEVHGVAPEVTERDVQGRWPGEARERVFIGPKPAPKEVK